MPNLIPLYLYCCQQEGVPVAEMAAALGVPAAYLEERLEAARLCFERQCVLELTLPR